MAESVVNKSTRTIGATGIKVGPLSFGLWRVTSPNVSIAQDLIEAALDAEMNLIDTADVYGFDWGGTGSVPSKSCSAECSQRHLS